MTRLLILFATALLGTGLFPTSAISSETSECIRFVPPEETGEFHYPGSRRPLRVRCSMCAYDLTAVMPENTRGYTFNSHPTFIVYVPSLPGSEEEEIPPEIAANRRCLAAIRGGGRRDLETFTILFGVEGENGDVIYETQFETDDVPGIMELKLPETAPPLAVGTRYFWYFEILCNPDEMMSVEGVFGWVERLEPGQELEQQMEAATEVDRAILYAKNGVWYDAVATLATLKRSQPEDIEIASLWEALLSQVGLESLSNAAFVSFPETSDRQSLRSNEKSRIQGGREQPGFWQNNGRSQDTID